MAGPVLTVAVTADVTDLQTKLAAARAAFNANSNELNKLAREAQATGSSISSSMNPAVQQLAEKVARGKAEINAMAAELRGKLRPALEEATESSKKHNEEHAKFGGVIAQNRVAFAELEHSVRAVADGLAAGISPARIFSEEFFRVGQALSSFNTISASTLVQFGLIGAAVASAAAGVAYYAHRLEEARDSADLSASFKTENLNIPADVVQSYRRMLLDAGYSVRALGDLTDAQVDKIIRSFAKINRATPDLIGGLVNLLPDFSARIGAKSAEDGAAVLASALRSPAEAAKLLSEEFDKTGQAEKTFNSLALEPLQQRAFFLKTIAAGVREYGTSLDSTAASSARAWGNLVPSVAALLDPLSQFKQKTDGLGEAWAQSRVEDSAKRTLAAIKDFEAYIASSPKLSPDLTAIHERLEEINQQPALLPFARLKEQVDYLRGLKDISDDPAISRLFKSVDYSYQETAADQALKDIRQKALAAGAAAVADRKDQAAAELAVYKAGLADQRLTAEAAQQLNDEISQTTMRLNRANRTEAIKDKNTEYQDFAKAEELKLAKFKDNIFEQEAILRAWTARAAQIYGADSAQALEVAKRAAEFQNEQIKRVTEERIKAADIQRSLAQAQANLDEIGGKGKIDFAPSLSIAIDPGALQADVAAKIAILRKGLEDEIAGLNQAINEKLAAGDKQGAASDYATETAKLKSYLDNVQRLNEQTADAVEKSWEKIVSPIGNAFDSILGAAVKGGQNIRQVEAQAAASVLQSWAKSLLQVVEKKAAAELRMLLLGKASDAAQGQSSDQATQKEIAGLTAQVAKFVAAESAKTGAVIAGTSVQTAVKGQAAAAGAAQQAAANSKTIIGDASKAFSGTYAALAGIPIIGPIIAPVAAAGAFAAVAGYETIASAEGGWDRVPYDGAPAVLHQDEMVLPRDLAEGVRNMVASGPSLPQPARLTAPGTSSVVNSSGDVSHTININHAPVINATGAGVSAAMANALKAGRDDLYHNINNWYGNNAVTLPGRKTWR